MNRIDQKLAQLRTTGRKMLSPYITAGDPEPSITVNLMHALVDAGADVLELGMPFSDPMSEGVVIQAAMERALLHAINCDDVLSMVQEFRLKDKMTPIVLMGYLNPIEQYGYEAFATAAQTAGVDGVIVVDLPPEEGHDLTTCFQSAGIHSIYLCSPTTSDERMSLLNDYARGYLYYVSLKGVTGSDALDLASVQQHYQRRKTQTSLPVMIGFGIKTAEMAAQIASFADGVIVGAALIEVVHQAYVEKNNSITAGAALIASMRHAMDKRIT